MDFSAFNVLSSNRVNIAARCNDKAALKRLLKNHNPNCVDNRGWTCLHEAAANSNTECIEIILRHRHCRPLTETYEGHTALYVACRMQCSIECIKLLLDRVPDIAQYASTEMVSPLHLSAQQGNVQLTELLLQYDSIIDLEDFDGDTPLHDAVCNSQSDVVAVLLHAGAQAEKINRMGFTPFQLACARGSMECVLHLYPFVTDINHSSVHTGLTPLMLASHEGHLDIVNFLLDRGANPNLLSHDNFSALILTLINGHCDLFKMLLKVTDKDCITPKIFLESCKPQFFKIDIMRALLESDLGPEFFNENSDFFFLQVDIHNDHTYILNLRVNNFLRAADYMYKISPDLFETLFFLLLERGVSVDALYPGECPPLVYIHYCESKHCMDEVIRILIEQGCNVDYGAGEEDGSLVFPDVVNVSLATGSKTLPSVMQYSLASEPDEIVAHLTRNTSNFSVIFQKMKDNLNIMLERRRGLHHLRRPLYLSESESCVPTLEHLCRRSYRQFLRHSGVKTTRQFLDILNRLPLPESLIKFIRYMA